MIYVTGDIHGGVSMYKLMDWEAGRKGDYLIVAGDFGYPWDYSQFECDEISWLESRPYTVLFVDGNHERYDHWAGRPVERWNGGLVQRLSSGSPIRRLMRGQVFDIDGETIFTFGGAASVDVDFRTPYIDWWPQELPDKPEFDDAMEALGAVDWEVDYVISHTCATRMLATTMYPGRGWQNPIRDRLTDFFDRLEERLVFRRWYYGHFHKDADVDDRHTVLFDGIVPLGGRLRPEDDRGAAA